MSSKLSSFVLLFIAFCLSVSILSCNNSEKHTNEIDYTDSAQLELPIIKKEPVFFRDSIKWVKQLPCNGFINMQDMITDKNGNIYLLASIEGRVEIDDSTSITDFSNSHHLLLFDSLGNFINRTKIDKNGNLRFFEHNDILHFAATHNSTMPFIDIMPSNTNEMGTGASIYRQDSSLQFEKIQEFKPLAGKSIRSLTIDSKGNYLVGGSKNIRDEFVFSGCTGHTSILNSTPYLEKYNNDSLLWNVEIQTPSIGYINAVHSDSNDNVWAVGYIERSDSSSEFGIPKISETTRILLKLSGNGKHESTQLFNYSNTWGIMLHFRGSTEIISYSETSCFKFIGTKYPPFRIYDKSFNLLSENCLADTTNARLNLKVLIQNHQVVAIGSKRTGLIQPGESKQAFNDKQRMVYLQFDKNGELMWSKRINTTLKPSKLIATSDSGFLLFSKSNDPIMLSNLKFEPKKRNNYYLIKYKPSS